MDFRIQYAYKIEELGIKHTIFSQYCQDLAKLKYFMAINYN